MYACTASQTLSDSLTRAAEHHAAALDLIRTTKAELFSKERKRVEFTEFRLSSAQENLQRHYESCPACRAAYLAGRVKIA